MAVTMIPTYKDFPLTGRAKSDFFDWCFKNYYASLLQKGRVVAAAIILQWLDSVGIIIQPMPGLAHCACYITDHKTLETDKVVESVNLKRLLCTERAILLANEMYNKRK